MEKRDVHIRTGLLALVFGLALLPFATVHEAWRVAVGAVAGGIALGLLWVQLGRRAPPREPVVVAALAALAWLGAAVGFLGVDELTRARWQPGLHAPVQSALALVGAEQAPLALDPHRGLIEWGLTGVWIALGLAAVLACGERHRAARLARRLVILGVVLVGVAVAHRVGDAPYIWWKTGVPTFVRAPFFGPFVNHNDGGLACAALAVLAAGLALRESGRGQALGALAVALLLAGARLSGSRGALLAAGVGLLTLAAVALGRPGRWMAGLGVLGAAAVTAWWGPRELGRALSEWIVPEALSPHEDVYTGRGDLFGDSLSLIGAAPWVGTGQAGFDEGFQLVKSTPDFTFTAHAHQELLQLTAEHGLAVALLWTAALVLTGLRVARAALEPQPVQRLAMLGGYAGSAAALVTGMMFSFPLRIGALEVLASLLLGGALGVATRDSPPPHGLRRPLRAVAMGLGLLALLALLVGSWLRDHPSSPWGSAEAAIARGDARLEGADPLDRVRHAEAAGWYALAVRRHPTDRVALQKLSQAALVARDLEQGLGALEVAVQVYPTLPWVHRDLARLLRRLGDFDESRDRWRVALSLDIPRESQDAVVAEALKGPGDLREIVARTVPERPDRLVSAARVAEQAGDRELAEALLRRAVALEPKYLAWLAWAQLRWGQAYTALHTLEGAPDLCMTADVRASALLALLEGDAAVPAYERALRRCGELDPAQSRRLRVGLARARLLTGDLRGMDALEALVAQSPGDHALRRVLLAELRSRGLDVRSAPQLKVLIEAGVATAEERAAYALVRAELY